MYKVLKYFTDLQDNKHAYKAGDTFPREGVTVSKARIAELSSKKNRQREPLIMLVEDAVPAPDPASETKAAETAAKVAVDAKPKQKRGRKKNAD